MNLYTIIKFIHVTGALGYFIAVGTALFVVAALRRARRVEQVRALIELMGWLPPLFSISVAVLLIAGLYMAFTAWSLQTGWILVALITLLLIFPIATLLVGPRQGAIAKLAREAEDGPLPAALAERIQDPALLATPRVAMAVLLGIVFLMTNKPSWQGALVVMVIALALGLVWGILLPRLRGSAEPRQGSTAAG